jgi:hypothetical protein
MGEKRRWKYNIKMELKEAGWDGADWIHLAQDKGKWCYKNDNVFRGVICLSNNF